MSERQTQSDPQNIRADHRGRYLFAKDIVSGNVLDVACGCGYGSHILAQAGHNVRGVDNSREAIDFAEAHYSHERIRYVQANALHIVGLFDWVVSFETVEHIREDGELLRRFAMLSPNLILSVPNQDVRPYSRKRFPYHERHYTKGELDALLRGTGWRAVRWCSQPSLWDTTVLDDTNGHTFVVIAERA